MVAGGKLALASAAPGYFKKESEPVITGDRKVASISCIAFCHPFHGLHNIFVHNRGCARCAGLPLPFIFYPLARAQNSAGVRPRIRKIKSIVNLKNLHKCLIYADFTLLVYRYTGEAVCLPYPLRPRRELLALSFGFLSAALPLIRGEFRTLPFPPLAATCRCIHL